MAELLLCQTLRAAVGKNFDEMRKAESQLQEWETQSGFFPMLARLCNKNEVADPDIRWMAAVYLKNGIERHWRRSSRIDLPAEHKQEIRQQLLQHFHAEDKDKIAAQVTVAISRIARFDCPREWPELIPELLRLLQALDPIQKQQTQTTQPDAQRHQRVLFVMHHTLKAISTRRQMADRRQFEELTRNIYGYMLELWNGMTTQFLAQVKTLSETEALSQLQRVHIVARSLRKLTVYGFARPYKSEECMSIFPQIFQRLRQCLELRYEMLQLQPPPPSPKQTDCEAPVNSLLDRLEHFILKMMKLLNDFLEQQSLSFARFVPVALEFSFHYIFHEGTALIFDATQCVNFPNFAIQAINLIKGIIQCNNHTIRANSPSCPVEKELSATASTAQEEFFTEERISYICEKIITHYLLLTPQELQEWSNNPETFGQLDKTGDAWRFGLRACVETFYLSCYHAKNMTAEVCKYIRNAQQLELNADSDLKTILQKDAIYNAAGLAAYQFFHDVDFGAWFGQQLINELRIEAPNFRILRRRIIWLLGECITVKFSRDMRPLAYEACLHLLRSDEDMCIRLAASRTLHALIDDFDFAPEPFRPYFPASFNAFFMLLRESEECDTKIAILGGMSLLVDKMSEYIEAQAEQLISYLPLLWQESDEFEMLRVAIISALEQIVKTIRDIPGPMKPFLYSVVHFSTDLKQPSHIYLMEDGIILWSVVVENSTTLSPELFALCENLLPIIELSSEYLRTVLHVIHSYIVLDPQAYLSTYGSKFVSCCTRMIEDTRTEGIVYMMRIYESCLKADAVYGINLLRPALPYIFNQVYLGKEYPMLMSFYLMIVARTLLIDQTVFMSVIEELQYPDALAKIMDVWIAKLPLVNDSEKLKLYCLAFASIFGNHKFVLERFPAIMQHIKDTLVVIMETDDSEEDSDENKAVAAAATTDNGSEKPKYYFDQLVIQDENELDVNRYMDDFYNKTYHYDRCRALALKDPIHKISLVEYLSWQLKSMEQQLGNERFQQLLKEVYPEVLEKIQMYIKYSGHKTPNVGDAVGAGIVAGFGSGGGGGGDAGNAGGAGAGVGGRAFAI